MDPVQPCPCGIRRPYADCCGRWHAGPLQHQAPDAEALMRSRYSAYVLDDLAYLRATWAPETCPADLAPNPPGLRWLGLEVKAHAVQDADHATVSFVARSKLGGHAHRLQETSRFERRGGRWLYVDGAVA
jgi:SEC-C motif-containing protein